MWPGRREFLPNRDCPAPGPTGNERGDATFETPHLGAALVVALVCLAYAGVARAQVVPAPVSEPPAAPAAPPAEGDGPRAARGARGTACGNPARGTDLPWRASLPRCPRNRRTRRASLLLAPLSLSLSLHGSMARRGQRCTRERASCGTQEVTTRSS